MTGTADVHGPWAPATPAEVADLLAGVTAPWWIAGGWAIELFAGRHLRAHADIDVLLLRRDQLAAQVALAGWEWWAADPPGTLRRWRPGEVLPVDVHDVWCRPGPDSPWRLQFMLDEAEGADWVSRRDHRVRRSVEAVGARSRTGLPYVVPEIQLYYKAARPRPKDHADLAAVADLLTGDQRRWLHDALGTAYGSHPWQRRLGLDLPGRRAT